MKFQELFDIDMNPLWDKILTIKEFAALKDAKHDQMWHHEDPLQHTINVTNRMREYLEEKNVLRSSIYYLIMMSSALCHDIGKAETFAWDEKLNKYTCKRHDIVGEKITRKLFYDSNFYVRESVCYMVRWHMKLHYILEKNEDEKYNLITFFDKGIMPLKELFILNRCDSLGSVNDIETEETLFKRWHQIEECINAVHKKPKFNAYVMIGLPGSGKDTYIHEHLSNLPVLCRDNIRTEIGLKGDKPMGNKEEENKVTLIFNERLKTYCQEHKDFVINNTNLLRKYRDEFGKVIRQYGGLINYVYVEAPSLETNKERRKGQMPLDVIDRMLSYMEFPQADEYDTITLDIQKKN